MIRLVMVWVCVVVPCFAGEEDVRFEAFLDDAWAQYLLNNPVTASFQGVEEAKSKWEDSSLEAFDQYHQQNLALKKRLQSIDVNALTPVNQLNYKLFSFDLERDIESYQHRWFLIPLNQRAGIQTLDTLVSQISFNSRADYLAWMKRLEGFSVLMDQTITLMRTGMKEGKLLPKVVMKRIPPQIEKQIFDDPSESGFYAPFRDIPDTIEGGAELAETGRKLVDKHVIASYRKFHRFFTEEYLPACPEKVGISHLPGGKEMYEFFARNFTSTDMTPQEIHDLGQKEVARIRAEMMEIIKQVKFEGSFAEFLHFLRTDPQFYYKTPEELFQAYQALAKRIDPTLVKLFDKMPRMPYGVEAIPDSFAPDTTTAYYNQPNPDGTNAGTYFVNLYQPETRPKYEMEALSIHEAVPGHHFQIALAQELDGLPNFRRYGGLTAYVEGWALYAESLGGDLGFYKDPYSKFGQLTYEMWRAVRLVVDTGIHYLGWSREQSIDFFKANAAKSEQDIVNEIDRYIAWPGQALGYKIGELKIKELRKRAEEKLGDKFDIKGFHNVVLEEGPVPLVVLEDIVNQWIAKGGPRTMRP